MIGAGGGIGRGDGGIGAEMPGQVERQLHARRKSCKALVDAELEVEGAILMPQHDRGRDRGSRRRASSRSRTAPVSASAGAARRTKAASPSSCISAVPRLPFQPLASSCRNVSSAAATCSRVRATSKRTAPCSAKPMALAAQLLQFLCAQRIMKQFLGIARGVERGAEAGLQHARTQAVSSQHLVKDLHGRAIERHVAQDQRMRAGFARRPQQFRRGILRHVAIEQRRAQRAVGFGARQSGQRNFAGAPHRDRQASCRSGAARRPAIASPGATSADTPVRPRANAFTASSQPGR